MFSIFGQQGRFCDGVSRRDMLQIGALGVGGLTLADVFRSEAAAGETKSPKSIINVFLGGGPSHIDMFDLKPDAPKEIRGEFNPIDTNVSGIQICEHMPRLAAMMDKLAIVRSIAGLRDEHAPNQPETGWDETSLKSVGGRPSIGSIIAKLQGPTRPDSPAFVDLNGHSKHGFLGPVFGAFRPDGEGRSNLKLNGVTVDRLEDRRKLLTGLDRLRREADTHGMMEAMDSFTQRAVGVVTSGRIADALNLEKEDPRIRERYNSHNKRNGNENDRFLVARRLVEAGVRCVSLSWGGWDTHGDNFNALRRMLPPLDQGLATLVEDLEARGMYEDTTILVWGEFGRTPRVNGTMGRDHWARVASVLIGGGGLRMGQVVGSTNRLGEIPKDRPVHLQEIFATLYHNMGIDTRYTTLIDPNGRPQYLVDHREPMREFV